MFAPDHEGAEVVASLGYRRGALGPRREHGGIILHVTGSGPLRRLTERRFARWRRRYLERETVLDAAVAVYRTITKNCPQYVAGMRDGEPVIVQVAPESRAARHVGSYRGRQYKRADWADRAHYRGKRVDVEWWPERWGGLPSPLDFGGGSIWGPDLSVNRGSHGIEFAWPFDDERTEPPDALLQRVAELVEDICNRRAIQKDVYHVVGHSDIHPAARTSRGEPWDPPPEVLDGPAAVARMMGWPLWSPPTLTG